MNARELFASIPPGRTLHISPHDYGVEMRMITSSEVNVDGHATKFATTHRTIGIGEVDRNPALDYVVDRMIKEMVLELSIYPCRG